MALQNRHEVFQAEVQQALYPLLVPALGAGNENFPRKKYHGGDRDAFPTEKRIIADGKSSGSYVTEGRFCDTRLSRPTLAMWATASTLVTSNELIFEELSHRFSATFGG